MDDISWEVRVELGAFFAPTTNYGIMTLVLIEPVASFVVANK